MTPDLVAAVTNTFIDVLGTGLGEKGIEAARRRVTTYDDLYNLADTTDCDFLDPNDAMYEALVSVLPLDPRSDWLHDDALLPWMKAVGDLAIACEFAQPFELAFTMDGEPVKQRCTITYFAEGVDYDHRDLFSIHALDMGATYVKRTESDGDYIITRVQ